MTNLKKFFIYFILLISSIVFFQSCEREADEQVPEVVKCSPASTWGECENEEEMCYKGVCTPKDAKCGTIMAPCEDKYDLCVADLENGGFKCTEGRCSYNNINGTCRDEKEICTSAGACEYACSAIYKHGACLGEKTCLDGLCVDTVLLCSDLTMDGLCEDGKTCSINNATQSSQCLDSCSKQFPTGACSTDKICKYEKCYYSNELCSLTNFNGVCADGKLCSNGVCERECSSLVQNGLCQFDDQVCFDGKCSFKCSEVRLDGICEDIATRCLGGSCKYKCSSTVQDGYCDVDNNICIDGYCKKLCSSSELSGVCEDRTQVCSGGSCEYKCSQEHLYGVCEEEGKACFNGSCIEECSSSFPYGSCPQYFECKDEECKEIECGQENLNGPCLSDSERCIEGICLNQCSNLQANGWCEQENFICNNNTCIDSTQQECSPVFTNGLCSLDDETCIAGICLKKMCSPEYPNGRCEDNRICTGGACLRYSCSDDRPLYQGGNISVDDGGISGSCCQVNEDCKDGFDSQGHFITNVCIEDHNSEGPYCLGIHLTSNDNAQTNNDSMLCQFIDCNGCQKDEDCRDPYSTYGTEEEYFCAMIVYYDFEVPVIGKKDINISYCQRVFPNCTRKNTQQGEECNEDCHDSECATGLHCIKGICTGQCKDDSSCLDSENPENSASCIPITYHLSDTDKDLFLDICAITCENNSRCSDFNINYTCSAFTYEYQVAPGVDPASMISYCRDKDQNATGNIKDRCFQDTDCKNRICGLERVCTAICGSDSDCGINAYCHYNKLQTGAISHLNAEATPIDLNYLGECRYLSSTQGTVQSCSSKSDCPTELVNGKSYQCLPKLDFVKDLPNGKSGDTVYGGCGVLTPVVNKAYSDIGESCNSNQLCESDLCICGDKHCKNQEIGNCASYCEESSDCTGDEYCKRILLREGVKYSKAVYTGICKSRNEGVDIELCNTINSSSSTICSSDKTCIANAVNTKPDVENPNMFNSEYICVKKYSDRLPLNEVCTKDSECNSQLCSKFTNKCSHACNNNSQCDDIASSSCNMENILVDDVNPSYAVKSGICE